MVDISVVIVSWNARDYLAGCLNSLKRFDIESLSLEIIVVDNASSDGSPEMVRSEYAWVTLVENKENLGFAKANNIGILSSQGKYICLVNSDVVVGSGCLESLHQYMEEATDVGLVGPRITYPDGTLQTTCKAFPNLWRTVCGALALNRLVPGVAFFESEHLISFPYNIISKVDAVIGCFMFVRRKALDEIGPLDENFFIYAEDVDWCRRFRSAGWQVVFYPESHATHFGGASSANAPVRFAIELERAMLYYWRKHHSMPLSWGYIMVRVLHHGLRLIGNVVRHYVGSPTLQEDGAGLARHKACIGVLLGRESRGVSLNNSQQVKT